MRTKVVYQITYPKGKIHIGMDLTGSLTERRDFTVRKEILWQSDTATDLEVRRREVELILELRSRPPDDSS